MRLAAFVLASLAGATVAHAADGCYARPGHASLGGAVAGWIMDARVYRDTVGAALNQDTMAGGGVGTGVDVNVGVSPRWALRAEIHYATSAISQDTLDAHFTTVVRTQRVGWMTRRDITLGVVRQASGPRSPVCGYWGLLAGQFRFDFNDVARSRGVMWLGGLQAGSGRTVAYGELRLGVVANEGRRPLNAVLVFPGGLTAGVRYRW